MDEPHSCRGWALTRKLLPSCVLQGYDGAANSWF
jgi:hypothetical protein